MFLEEQGKPVAIVLPHALIGDGFQIRPDGYRLVGFGGGSGEVFRAIDVAEDIRAVRHGEAEFAEFAWEDGGDEEFLLGFADGGLERSFAGIDLAAWAVDFACAEPAFFSDEEDLVVVEDEHERGAHGWVP